MADDPKAVIAGASVAGLTTACGLAERGWSVTVLEQRLDLLEGGRAITLQPNGLAALERLGVLGSVRELGHRLARVLFIDERFRALASWDYTELRVAHPYLVEVRPATLRGALAERLAELGGDAPRLGCELMGLARRGNIVTGARYRDRDGHEHELDAAVVIGADGPDSVVRGALGIHCRRFGGPDRYLLGTVQADGSGEELLIYLGRGYGDGVVPLGDGTYLWDRVTAENRVAVDAGDLAGWRSVYEQRLPPGSEIPGAVTSWQQLTPVQVRPFWAKAQIADGSALVGDAAGVVHPHSAQGANLALEDAVALAEVLAHHQTGQPVPRHLLTAYGRPRQRRRRRFVLESLLAAGFMDAPNPAWRPIRAANLAGSRIGPARRALLKLGIN